MLGWLRYAAGWLTGTLPPTEFEGDGPPEWVVVIRVLGLVVPRFYSIRVQLWPERITWAGTVWWGPGLPIFWTTLPGPGEVPEQQAVLLNQLAERAAAEPTPA